MKMFSVFGCLTTSLHLDLGTAQKLGAGPSSSPSETASSYLLILQNLEPPAVAQNHATLLLDSALDTSNWELAKELVRFLRTIGRSHVAPAEIYVISACVT